MRFRYQRWDRREKLQVAGRVEQRYRYWGEQALLKDHRRFIRGDIEMSQSCKNGERENLYSIQ